jgi:hypothetical protein
VLRIFIALKNPSPWQGFEPATFGSSGQHTNHYITKAISFSITLSLEMGYVYSSCLNEEWTVVAERFEAKSAQRH